MVRAEMIWLGSLQSLSERDGVQYVSAGPRIRTTCAGSLDDAIRSFCTALSNRGCAGVAYFSAYRERTGEYLLKGDPFKKK